MNFSYKSHRTSLFSRVMLCYISFNDCCCIASSQSRCTAAMSKSKVLEELLEASTINILGPIINQNLSLVSHINIIAVSIVQTLGI